MKLFSAYERVVEYLVNEFRIQYEEGYNIEAEYLEAVDGLSELSANQVMAMCKEVEE